MITVQEIAQDLKTFDWDNILLVCNSLGDFNSPQWRFTKGLVIEIAVEEGGKSSEIVYVGQEYAHKDYDWPKHGVTLELKSVTSSSMYFKNSSELRKGKRVIKFNNSNGTNNASALNPDHVADFLIVVHNDGAYVIDKAAILSSSKGNGDGWTTTVKNSDIVEITGKREIDNSLQLNLRDKIFNLIKDVINDVFSK